jgi:hypothetical protein
MMDYSSVIKGHYDMAWHSHQVLPFPLGLDSCETRYMEKLQELESRHVEGEWKFV